ncbi:MAG: ATP-grasp domain-containing protein [Pseudomonadota bacterium]
MTKIAVTGAGAVLGQGIIKSLKSASRGYEILAYDPDPRSPGLYWGHAHGLLPMAKDPEYKATVEAMLEREKPAAVLVGTDVELEIFAENRAEWEERFGTHIVVSSPEIIRIADDKLETARWLEANGLPFPKSVPGEDTAAIDALVADIGFPLIVKPRIGARAVGVSMVNNRAKLDAALKGREGLVVQQWAGPDDQEYTAGALCFDGEVKASIVLRRDLRDGNTFRAYADDYPECEDYVRNLAQALQPYGPANFQFRRGPDGVFRLFEINARYSGTTPMRGLLGFNEVDMVLGKLLFGEEITQPPLQKGTVVRFLEEQLLPAGYASSSQGVD